MNVFKSLEKPIELSALDLFVVELTILCDAKYFMAWGRSSISIFFIDKVCRGYPFNMNKVTLHDDMALESV